MVTVFRFHVYYKVQSKSGKLYRKEFRSAAFATAECAFAALRSWVRVKKEYYAESGKYFEVMNYFIDSSFEELRIEDIICLYECKSINDYKYATVYYCPF